MTLQWDLGFMGLATLAAMSLAFGLFAHLLAAGTTSRWLWLIAAAVFFMAGLFISEVWFGWATERELQPNIDGLSSDEVLIAALVGIPVLLFLRLRPRTRIEPHA